MKQQKQQQRVATALSLKPPVPYQLALPPYAIVIGDFSNRNRYDLAVTNVGSGESNSGTISILQNLGNGTFQLRDTITVGVNP
ncbi:hypothetical protein [Ktedonobacter sp. SOSP1-52]|uniref:hypothetical protein n=1 Tax=Ktedonobacter sp. SOSP1-52 TaxID=2778366 RepID=UPI001915C69A|nr:hypothetical protein [Ktedonobacter sp. SOSP1-52]